MNNLYLKPFRHARWAISRSIAGKRICLVQDSEMDRQEDIIVVFEALDIPCSKSMVDLYFPIIGYKGRCPTLALLELFSTINRLPQRVQHEIGV